MYRKDKEMVIVTVLILTVTIVLLLTAASFEAKNQRNPLTNEIEEVIAV